MGIKIVGYKVRFSAQGKVRLEVLLETGRMVVFDEAENEALNLTHIVRLLESNTDIRISGLTDDATALENVVFSTHKRKAPSLKSVFSYEIARLKSRLTYFRNGTTKHKSVF